ncbi:hypothetical protein RPE78_16370 (plasmid) [Thioclava litoralis]|uniref:Uncharacterized protein n=1 Tax=Thioclava litoralis TaxID=3076557 RepID=A0ABZ1E449_9RHOB|nr:hypothetical protein RPE78_16370 [Thioclava sp. FTW29]
MEDVLGRDVALNKPVATSASDAQGLCLGGAGTTRRAKLSGYKIGSGWWILPAALLGLMLWIALGWAVVSLFF